MSSIDLVVSPPKRPAFLLLLLLSTDKQLKARPPTFLTTKPRRHSQVKVDSRVPRRLLATLIPEKGVRERTGTRQLSSQPAVSRLPWHAGCDRCDSPSPPAAPLLGSAARRRTGHARQISGAPQISRMFYAQDQPLQTHPEERGGREAPQQTVLSVTNITAVLLQGDIKPQKDTTKHRYCP